MRSRRPEVETYAGPPRDEPAPSSLTLIGRQLEYWATVYRRTWRGSFVNSFISPVLYLVAMGGVLGRFVDSGGSSLGAAGSYVEFVGPGLLAAQMMQMAVGEVLWPVMGRITWNKTYHAMISTPLRVRDVVAGHLLFVIFRIGISAAVFMLVLAVAGVFHSLPGALVVLAIQLLLGAAFAASFFVIGARARSDSAFSLTYRVAFMPMFLFSGAFFPVTNLPSALQVVAWVTPLWHGVELTRMFTLDRVDGPMATVHLAYLAVLGAAGWWLSVRALRGRLII